MYVEEGNQLGKGGAVVGGAAKGASVGATAGSVIPVVGTAIGAAVGAVIGAATSLIKGVKHFSPWGFLYDDYPLRIYNQEIQVANARNAIAQLTGGAIQPKPVGPPPAKGGGPTYQASMLDIVPRYVPGSESQIAAYDRRLNESGGAYERTFGMQQQLLKDLQPQLAGAQIQAAVRGNVPAPGSATLPPQLSPQTMVPVSPSTAQFPTGGGFYSSPVPPPTGDPNVALNVPNGAPGIVQAGFGMPALDMKSLPLIVIGGAALFMMLMSGKKGH